MNEELKQPTLPEHLEKAFDEQFYYDYTPGAVCQTSQESHIQELKDIKQWFAQTLETEVKKAEEEGVILGVRKADEWMASYTADKDFVGTFGDWIRQKALTKESL